MGTKCRFPDAVMAAENPAHCGLILAKNPSKISTGKYKGKLWRNNSWENIPIKSVKSTTYLFEE